MAFLIFEPEARTRGMIERSLKGFSSTPTVAFQNEWDAIKFLERNHRRVEMLIASDALVRDDASGVEFLCQTLEPFSPILILGSRGDTGAIRELRLGYPRIDASLTAPFNRASLFRGVSRAFRHRAKSRNSFLIWDESDSIGDFTEPGTPRSRHLLHVRTLRQFRESLREQHPHIGAILIDSGTFAKQADDKFIAALHQALASFWGRLTPLICVGTEATVCPFLRSHAEMFVPKITRPESLTNLLEAIERRIVHSWDCRYAHRRALQLLNHGHLWRAKWAARKVERFNGKTFQSFRLQAEIALRRGEQSNATLLFRQALAMNPFYVRAYAVLLPKSGTSPTPEQQNLIAQAARYCSQNRSILARCREYLGPRSKEIAKTLKDRKTE